MHFSTLFVPFLATLAIAAPAADVEAAAKKKPSAPAAAIIKDVKAISAGLTALNNTLNTFTPFQPLGVTTALKIQKESNALVKDIQKAINDTLAAPATFNSFDTGKIAVSTLNLVHPINTTLQNLVNHKPAFASAVLLVGDITKTVYNSLVEQRNLTATFGADLAPKLAAPFNAFAPATTNQILGYFDVAIKAFSNCTGVVCLPPV